MATRTLILQGIIPHYRVPIFNALGRATELTVAHSDPETRGSVDYEAVYLPDRSVSRFHYQRGVRGLARSFDVVFAMLDVYWLSSVQYCLTRGGKPFVWWGHGYGRSALANRLRDVLVRSADALLLYDEAGREPFVRAGVPTERIFVAPNTVLVEEPFVVDDAAKRMSFLFVGRLQARKRVDLAIEAFGRVTDRLPESVGFDIVGEGPESERLRSLVARHGLEARVRFHGEITDESALRQLFARALAYVSPGHVGLGVLHAFAYGVPVVTRRGPGHAPEVANLQDGENGLFVDLTVESLAEALLRLASDPAAAHRMGLAGHAHYTGRRTIDAMLQGFLDAIARVTAA